VQLDRGFGQQRPVVDVGAEQAEQVRQRDADAAVGEHEGRHWVGFGPGRGVEGVVQQPVLVGLEPRRAWREPMSG
jgi:hypothetical protein